MRCRRDLVVGVDLSLSCFARAARRCMIRTRVISRGIIALSFLSAVPASAQVLEIAPDGTVSVRSGAGAAVWQVVGPSGSSGDLDQVQNAALLPATVVTDLGTSAIPPRYSAAVINAASMANISPSLLAALVWTESRWNAGAVSPKGARGLTQLMPGTARELAVDPSDPAQNLLGGARYLRALLDQFDGNLEKALAAYNAGPARVRSAGGVPNIRETKAYVSSIVGRLSATIGGNQ